MTYLFWLLLAIYLISSFGLFVVASERVIKRMNVLVFIACYIPLVNTWVLACILLDKGWHGTFNSCDKCK